MFVFSGQVHIYVTGDIYTIAQNNNFCTIKYNPAGVQQWVAIYNGPGSNSVDQAVAIAIDKKGYIYVTGNSEETGAFSDAYCTIKYSSSGTQMWVARYSRTPHIADDPKAIAVDKNGNVYVTGGSLASNETLDYLTIKIDSTGIIKWANYYNGVVNSDDVALSIAVDDSCNAYVTGWSNIPQNTAGFCTIKYNTNGDSLWVRILGGLPNGFPNEGQKLVLDKWNNVYVAGYITTSNYATKTCVIKYNSSGVQQWVAIDQSSPNQSSQPYSLPRFAYR